jgi:hypothetical protein
MFADLKEVVVKELLSKRAEIDPERDHNWLDIVVGWGIAKGLTPNEANLFACHIIYPNVMGDNDD